MTVVFSPPCGRPAASVVQDISHYQHFKQINPLKRQWVDFENFLIMSVFHYNALRLILPAVYQNPIWGVEDKWLIQGEL